MLIGLDSSYMFTPGAGQEMNTPRAHGLSVGGSGSPEGDKDKLPPQWQWMVGSKNYRYSPRIFELLDIKPD